MAERVKYPRTPHLPWSPGKGADDIEINTINCFLGKTVVVTEKLDGECTTVYPDGYIHARSVDGKHHASRSWMKAFAPTFAYLIPEGWRVVGENLTAWHSIFYIDLPTYFFVFGIYDENNVCLRWSETERWCKVWGLHTVPVRFMGLWDTDRVKNIWNGQGHFPTYRCKGNVPDPRFPVDFVRCSAEGYVVRLTDAFPYDDFQNSCSKFVTKNHVQTDEHWLSRFIPNRLDEKRLS